MRKILGAMVMTAGLVWSGEVLAVTPQSLTTDVPLASWKAGSVGPNLLSGFDAGWSTVDGVLVRYDAPAVRLQASRLERTIPVSPGSRYIFSAWVMGTTANDTTRVVAVMDDGVTATRSSPVVLHPWWQMVAVSAAIRGNALYLAILREGPEPALVASPFASLSGPTRATTDRRQIHLNGSAQPFTIQGWSYSPVPPGSIHITKNWSANPQQCASDANLMGAAGVTTIRIGYLAETYNESNYRQCMDAFAANGVHFMWLVEPFGLQQDIDNQQWVEIYWRTLKGAIDRLGSHPGTIGWVIGNEMVAG